MSKVSSVPGNRTAVGKPFYAVSHPRLPLNVEIWTMILVLILSILGSAQAQHYCCGPTQWEANMGQLEGYYNPQSHDSGSIEGIDVISYDSVNQRMVTTAYLTMNGRPLPPVTVYNDYKHKMQYMITNGNCTVAPLTSPMPSHCIPYIANYTGSTYFGVGRDKLMLDMWTFEFPNMRLSVSITQNGCYPVSEGIVGEFGSFGSISQCKDNCVDAIIAFGITGMTIGIKSSSVFDIPESCQSGTSHDAIEGFTVGHHVHETRKRAVNV